MNFVWRREKPTLVTDVKGTILLPFQSKMSISLSHIDESIVQILTSYYVYDVLNSKIGKIYLVKSS